MGATRVHPGSSISHGTRCEKCSFESHLLEGRPQEDFLPPRDAHALCVCALCAQPSRAYLTKLLVMGRVMARQAGGRPTGPHAEFKELLVDAATARLSLGPPRGRDGGPTATAVCEPGACAMHLAEMLELSVRR